MPADELRHRMCEAVFQWQRLGIHTKHNPFCEPTEKLCNIVSILVPVEYRAKQGWNRTDSVSLLRNTATPSLQYSALLGRQNIIYSGSLLRNCATPSWRSSALGRWETLVRIDEGATGNNSDPALWGEQTYEKHMKGKRYSCLVARWTNTSGRL